VIAEGLELVLNADNTSRTRITSLAVLLELPTQTGSLLSDKLFHSKKPKARTATCVSIDATSIRAKCRSRRWRSRRLHKQDPAPPRLK